VCPIGMAASNPIRSKEPGAIAVAIAAELLAVRDAYAADTMPLSDKSRRRAMRTVPATAPVAIVPLSRNGHHS